MSDDEDALAKLRGQMVELNRLVERMGGELGPVRDNERQIKGRIADTHGGPGRFNPATAGQRKPMFESLTVSDEKNGAAKAEYKRIMRLVNAYTREAAMLERQLMKAKPKK